MAKLYKSGIMINCATPLCQKTARFFDPTRNTVNVDPAWTCDLCAGGKGPFIPKEKAKR